MLDVELQPAVRQMVERNEHLEQENKRLYDKVHELLAENSALKASRRHFRKECESMVTSQLLSPSKEIQSKLQRQRQQIERLQEELNATQSEATAAQKARSELQHELDSHEDNLEKSAQMECDAAHSCADIARTIESLIALCQSQEDVTSFACPDDLDGAIEYLERRIERLRDSCAVAVQERERAGTESNTFKQMMGEMETRIKVLETEKDATDECNRRYERERGELGKAIETLRAALEGVKENLITAEEEKKVLKEENVKLKIEMSELKEKIALAELNN